MRAEVTPYWGGYNAVITLRNTGRTQINGWTVTFTLPEGCDLLPFGDAV